MSLPPPGTVRVWDLAQRLMHWGLAASVALAWWAGESRLALHLWAGYAALGVMLARGVWGFAGSPRARFASFVCGPRVVFGYVGSLLRGNAPRVLGHNPLGGWMVLALLASVAVTGFSGWLYTTDRFWGLAWVDLLHRASAWTMVALIVLHVAGVLFTSLRHRENLVAAMLDGRKRP